MGDRSVIISLDIDLNPSDVTRVGYQLYGEGSSDYVVQASTNLC